MAGPNQLANQTAGLPPGSDPVVMVNVTGAGAIVMLSAFWTVAFVASVKRAQ